ncbi:MAG: TetR/AcrR family transcriptional regulator [Pseudomonadota bacterium]
MEHAKPRSSHHHGNLKEALVLYALEAAKTGALDDLSLRKASRDLGVSPGAAFRHFEDKDTLMRTVAKRGFDALASDFEAVLPFDSLAASASEARARFIALGQSYVSFARANYGLWRLMFGPYGLLPGQPLERHSTYSWLEKSLSELADFAIIAPADQESRFFVWSAIHGLSDLQASPAVPGEPGKGLVEMHCDFIISALSPKDQVS